ncbi:hypothetical protein ABQD63_10705, partial [Lactococcus garvieae]|uniref:hypothetical protein n=2 Tax=Lactococcus TaxID=1357 RepID=UPI0032E4C75D
SLIYPRCHFYSFYTKIDLSENFATEPIHLCSNRCTFSMERDVMNDNDIKRNIIVSVVGLVSILSLLLFEISLVGSDINFYLLLIMGLGLILFIVLLIGALKEKQKKKSLFKSLMMN